MTRGRGRLHIAPTIDLAEVRLLLNAGRSSTSLAASYGITVLSLERHALRAGDRLLADLIRKDAA